MKERNFLLHGVKHLVTPSQKVSGTRKRISDKFEHMVGLMEKMIKIQEDSEKAIEKWKLKYLRWRKGGRKRARISNEIAITSPCTTPSPECTWNFKYASPRPFK